MMKVEDSVWLTKDEKIGRPYSLQGFREINDR